MVPLFSRSTIPTRECPFTRPHLPRSARQPCPALCDPGRGRRTERAQFVGVTDRNTVHYARLIDGVLTEPPQRGGVGVQGDGLLGRTGKPVNMIRAEGK